MALVSLVSGLLIASLGGYILLQNKDGRMNRTFAVLAGFLALWAFTEFMHRQATDPAVAAMWVKTTWVFWPFSAAAFLHFTLRLIDHPALERGWTLPLLYIPPAGIAVVGVSTGLLSAGAVMTPWGYADAIPADPLPFIIAASWVLAAAVTAIILLTRFSIRTRDRMKRAETAYIAGGFVLVVLAGAITQIWLPASGIRVPELTTAFLGPLAAIIAYTIVRYELFLMSPATVARDVASTMNEALIIIDERGDIREANRAALDVLGAERDQIVGRPAGLLFADSWQTESLVDRAMNEQAGVRNHLTAWVRADGRPIPILYSTSVIRSRRGKTLGLIGIARDVTELREAESHRATAEVLQEAWLTVPGRIEGVHFDYVYRSATAMKGKVGGDFLDVFGLEEGRVAIVLGDVSGKGVEAAVMASLVKHGVKVFFMHARSPADICSSTNELVFANFTHGRFATLFVGILDTKSGELTYCNAGHPAPLIMHAGGPVEPLSGKATAVGALPGSSFSDERVSLAGGRLIIYTDGVTEARSGEEGFLGEARLLSFLRGYHGQEDIPQAILEMVTGFTHGSLTDDTLIVSLETPRARELRKHLPAA